MSSGKYGGRVQFLKRGAPGARGRALVSASRAIAVLILGGGAACTSLIDLPDLPSASMGSAGDAGKKSDQPQTGGSSSTISAAGSPESDPRTSDAGAPSAGGSPATTEGGTSSSGGTTTVAGGGGSGAVTTGGGCGIGCASGETCDAGTCKCIVDTDTQCPLGCFDLQEDRNNCGACSKFCSLCSAGRCFSSIGSTSASGAIDMALDADYVYFSNDAAGTITRASRDNGGVQVLAAQQTNTTAVAVDAKNVYWLTRGADTGKGTVMKMPLNGSSPTALATAEPYPEGIALDATNVYWTNYLGVGSVMKVPIAGGTKVELASGNELYAPVGLAVDASYVYWVNMGGGNDGSVMKVPIGGGTAVTLASGYDLPTKIALTDDSVYFATPQGARQALYQVSKTGGKVTTVLTTPVRDMAIFGKAIYLGGPARDGSTVVRFDLDGTNPVTLIGKTQRIRAIAVDAKALLWIAAAGEINTLPL